MLVKQWPLASGAKVIGRCPAIAGSEHKVQAMRTLGRLGQLAGRKGRRPFLSARAEQVKDDCFNFFCHDYLVKFFHAIETNQSPMEKRIKLVSTAWYWWIVMLFYWPTKNLLRNALVNPPALLFFEHKVISQRSLNYSILGYTESFGIIRDRRN